MITCCVLFIVTALHCVVLQRGLVIRTVVRQCKMSLNDATSHKQRSEDYVKNAIRWGASAFVGGAVISRSGKANAIGELYELRKNSMVLQDMCFNVARESIEKDCDAIGALFVNSCRVIRGSDSTTANASAQKKAVLGFGPDTYTLPQSFIPGISSFKEYGGHATITLESSTEQGTSLGNGLQYIKIGADTIRLSKAIEKGAVISYAYGWVDLTTPSGIHLQVIVGECRDPLMLACIQVSNMQESVEFFTTKLGMKSLPFPLARQKGSNFEPTQPKDSVFVSYGADTMGLLLVPFVRSKAAPVLYMGDVFKGFTIVVDTANIAGLPPYVAALYEGKNVNEASRDKKEVTVHSPDGYRFTLQPYEVFARQAK